MQAALSEKYIGDLVANEIQVMKDSNSEYDYGNAWDIALAASRSLRGDTGAGKELKEAVK